MRSTQWTLAVILAATLGGTASAQEYVSMPGMWMSPEVRYQLFSGPACSAPPYSFGPVCNQCRRPCCENAWADYCEKKSRCRQCNRRHACGAPCDCTSGTLTFSGAPGPWIEPALDAPMTQPMPQSSQPTPAAPADELEPATTPVAEPPAAPSLAPPVPATEPATPILQEPAAPEPQPEPAPAAAPSLPELQPPAPADAAPSATTGWLRRLPSVQSRF